MQTLLWRPSLSGGGGTKSAFHSTGQSTTVHAASASIHRTAHSMGHLSGPPFRQSTHLDLVEIRQCVPDIEGTKVAVAPRLLLLPGGGRALWGDVVGYGGRSGGGEGGGGGGRGRWRASGKWTTTKWSWRGRWLPSKSATSGRGNFLLFVSATRYVTIFPDKSSAAPLSANTKTRIQT